jgi:nucleotide-binding universal stress UspA family protein
MTRQLVVVGFDGSSISMGAVEWAADQAANRGASLRIVACYDMPVECAMAPMAIGGVGAIADAVQAGGTAALRMIQRRQPLLDAGLEVSAGPAASVLVHESRGADLLVVGSSGHHGAAAFWLGSTARSVARHCTGPLAVVRGLSASVVTKRIVVGVDDSIEADAAVCWAADEAHRATATLVIVHCWCYAHRHDLPSAQAREIEEIEAAQLLDRAIEMARERCGADVIGALREENPITALLSTARPGDVIVIGSPSHGAFLSSLLGSTVNGVLEESAVPVIVVPNMVGVTGTPGRHRRPSRPDRHVT